MSATNLQSYIEQLQHQLESLKNQLDGINQEIESKRLEFESSKNDILPKVKLAVQNLQVEGLGVDINLNLEDLKVTNEMIDQILTKIYSVKKSD